MKIHERFVRFRTKRPFWLTFMNFHEKFVRFHTKRPFWLTFMNFHERFVRFHTKRPFWLTFMNFHERFVQFRTKWLTFMKIHERFVRFRTLLRTAFFASAVTRLKVQFSILSLFLKENTKLSLVLPPIIIRLPFDWTRISS